MCEGANWDIIPKGESSSASRSATVNFEVTAEGSSHTGVVQFQIGGEDTAETIANKLAKEWNKREPIPVYAAARGRLTVFFLKKAEIAWLSEREKLDSKRIREEDVKFKKMAVTFQDNERKELVARHELCKQKGAVTWPCDDSTGPQIQVKRVAVVIKPDPGKGST